MPLQRLQRHPLERQATLVKIVRRFASMTTQAKVGDLLVAFLIDSSFNDHLGNVLLD